MTDIKKELAIARAEIAEVDALCNKLTDILSRTAIALRGPEPTLTRWSWHDLPERAAAAIAAIDLMQRAAQHLAGGRLHDSDCAMHNAPAYPAGECDCGIKALETENAALKRGEFICARCGLRQDAINEHEHNF